MRGHIISVLVPFVAAGEKHGHKQSDVASSSLAGGFSKRRAERLRAER